jgi:hypothetical protein
MPRGQRERERTQQKKARKRPEETSPGADTPAVDQHEAVTDPVLLEVATEIAAQLGETEDGPRGTILRIVERLGEATARGILQETLAIEAHEGLWLGDGSRRRTPGGVFFYLVRQRAAKPDRLAIFYPDYEQIVPLTAEDLAALLSRADQWPRSAAQRVRLRLLGRPAKIPAPDVPADTPYVIFSLKSEAQQAPPLPKGLPQVSAATTYRILATTDQWLKIAPTLLQQPEARISVSGDVAISLKRPELITVRAHSIKLIVAASSAEKNGKGDSDG